MKTDSDFTAASELIGFGTSFLKWVACFAAIYLLVLDRTNWKTNILTPLLIPYIYLSLPSWLFGILSGEIGKWIAFIGFPRLVRDAWDLHLPAHRVLLTAGTRPGIRWVQKLLHKEQWPLQLHRHPPPLRVPGLGSRAFLSLEHLRIVDFSVQMLWEEVWCVLFLRCRQIYRF